MEHAERLCTRLIMLDRGRKVFDGNQEQARAMLPGRVRLCAKADPSRLPGVARVEQLPSTEDGWSDWQVVLKAGAEPGDVLQACVETGFALRRFEAHSATLHDVFLHLAAPPAEDPQ
jgi:ABC-2 type transport system ATP-binding protein